MRRDARDDVRSVEDYRNYLLLLVRLQMGPRLRAKVDASDVVQQAILHAHERRAQFRGTTEGEWQGWLRAILANALAAMVRRYDAQARDPSRERSLEAELERSSSSPFAVSSLVFGFCSAWNEELRGASRCQALE